MRLLYATQGAGAVTAWPRCVAVFRVRGTLLNTVVKSQVWRFQAKEPLTSNPSNFEPPIDS